VPTSCYLNNVTSHKLGQEEESKNESSKCMLLQQEEDGTNSAPTRREHR